jgi:acetyl-CoA carboxylase biotin carboxyl carrier protein
MSASGNGEAERAHEAAEPLGGRDDDTAQDHVAAVSRAGGDELDAGHVRPGWRQVLKPTSREVQGLISEIWARIGPVVIVPGGNRRGRSAVAAIDAHITGTVWKIEVAVGDAVEEGDTVVILESMKMEMPVEAEDDGTVR